MNHLDLYKAEESFSRVFFFFFCLDGAQPVHTTPQICSQRKVVWFLFNFYDDR